MRRKLGSALLPIAGFALFLAGLMVFGDRYRVVVPHRVYRSAQLSPEALEERIERDGLQSILNLRGDKEDREWYREEVEVARRKGVELRSLDLTPERLPSRLDVVALIDYIEGLPKPLLIHCSAGADRTGFASVIARMAVGGAGLDEARSELSIWRGHIPFGPAAEIGRLFDQYEEHRRQSRAEEGWAPFEHWARELYVPYVYSARLLAVTLPSEAAPGERMDVRVRVLNTSPGPWVFARDEERGIKLGIRLLAPGAKSFLDYDRHGQFDRTLNAGEELEIDFALWAPPNPGEYLLKIDMVDEHVSWFEDQGSEPLVRKLVVTGTSEPKPAL